MKEGDRFAGLDGLRAVFCVGIVIYHVNEVFHSPFSRWLGPIYRYGGYFGNYMFFMLSGLLTAYHYKMQVTGNECRAVPFMARRILKIYPLYALSNLAMVCLSIYKSGSVDIKRLCMTFLMMSSGWFGEDVPYNHAAWFLCVLILCYFLYYLTGRFSERYPDLYLPACICLAAAGAVLEVKNWDFPFLYSVNGEGYMNFFVGVLLAELLMKSVVKRKAVAVVCGVTLGVLAAAAWLWGLEALPGDVRWSITAVCAALICLTLSRDGRRGILTLTPVQMMGRCSLSVYLWHVPVVWWFLVMEDMAGVSSVDGRLNFMIYFLILIVLSVLSRHYLEKKNRLWKMWQDRYSKNVTFLSTDEQK